MSIAVSVRDLTKQYPGGKVANDSIDLDIEKGTIFAILGPNGAGKTTFVRQIATELLPTSGEIQVLGIDAIREPRKVVQHIGVVPQELQPYGDLTVFEHVYYIARLRGLSKSEARSDTSRVISQLGLDGESTKLVGNLSGGLKRRTVVATAFTGKSELLILDEPSTGLDPVARRSVWKVLKQSALEGRTVILTTHYVEEAEALADRIAVFNNGKVVACDHPETIKSSVSGLFRLTLKREETSGENMVDFLEALQSMGFSDVKDESGGTLSVRVKADERNLLSVVFDWTLKNGFVANVSPITLEDAYLEVVK